MAVLVSNDLTYDQRVAKTCHSLNQWGWDIWALGRLMPNSGPGPAFSHTRIRLPFQRGFAFYASLQWAILWKMRNEHFDAIWANDLDTLLPAFMLSWWRGVPLIYDSHEFFTEAAGLTGRPFHRGVWLLLERLVFPRLKAVITVNDSIADAYAARYPQARSKRPLVVRNMPLKRELLAANPSVRSQYGISEDGLLMILQGAFMDQDRGVREALGLLDEPDDWSLLLVGAGPEFDRAKSLQSRYGDRLICLDKLPFDALFQLTASADIGLSLDQGKHGNYWMSLPNKLFDYIHAGLPVVATAMPEVKKVVEAWEIGCVVPLGDPAALANAIREVRDIPRKTWQDRCRRAADSLHWASDEKHLIQALVKSGAHQMDGKA